jgi:hypothetical protein
MSRRASLPGADELFRSTGGGSGAADSGPTFALVGESALASAPLSAVPAEAPAPGVPAVQDSGRVATRRPARDRHGAERTPTGRERHEEKITVYVSAEELVELERGRLLLRAEHGLAVDRGRIVRESLAVVLADLEAKGGSSILVRRLRGH